jgi:hypothetical protein
MKYLCGLTAILLLIVFSAVNLFLPYALLAFALIVGLAVACGTIKKRSGQECPLGFC